MKAKRTKKETNAKVAPGMASILERGEITIQQLNAAVSGKAQKYERVGARQFVPFDFEEMTIDNIKKACMKHFKVRKGLKCDVLSGDRGPSCKSMNHIPDWRVVYVRFIDDETEDEDSSASDDDTRKREPFDTDKSALSFSPEKRKTKEVQKTKSTPNPVQVYPKSMSVASMINLGKLIQQPKLTVVDISCFDIETSSWSTLPTKAEFVISEDHFAQGGFRKAYKATSQTPRFSNSTWVIKKYLPGSIEDIKVTGQEVEGHTKKIVQMHMLAKNLAEQLVCQVRKRKLQGFGECFAYKQIYLGWISEENAYVTIEQFIPGDFVKYVNNTGLPISVNGKDDTKSQKAECLVHFSYIKSNQQLMLVDIQGSNYDLYDPEIASAELIVDHEILFCVGNLSRNAITSFLDNHVCNKYCKMLELNNVNTSDCIEDTPTE